jgi:hypothetical protein
MMSPTKRKFVELEKRKEEVKRYFEELAEAVSALAAEVGVNGYFQDEEGTVYKVVEPEGKFVHFEKLSYVRTRRPGEKRGDLSMKEATEAGFILPNQ